MKHLSSIFLIVMVLARPLGSYAQIDTVFWFAAPEVSAHVTKFDVPLYLNITSIQKDAIVEISLPANPGIGKLTQNVSAGTSVQVDISHLKDQLENTPANIVLNKGLLIRSTEMVQVYYDVASTYCNCNPELFTLKGRNALGTEFYIPSQTSINIRSTYTPRPSFSFDVVATEDATDITIIPTKNLVGHTAGIPYTVRLNRGQTYSGAALGLTGPEHPAGTFLRSTRPVAVTIKDDLLEGIQFAGGCADLTGDQIVPVSMLGTHYVLVRGLLGTGAGKKDLACITAVEDNTIVYKGGVQNFTLNAGETDTIEVRSDNAYIESSKPVYVLHISGIGCELGSALLPPLKCTGSNLLGMRRSASVSFLLYLNLIVPGGAETGFLANGNAGIIKSSDFKTIPGTTDWLSATVLIDSNFVHPGQSLIVSNSKGRFHMGIFAGNINGGTAYGYISDYSKSNFNAKTIRNCGMLKARQIGDSLRWFNGSRDTQMLASKPGIYWVDYFTACETIRDSFVVVHRRVSNSLENIVFCGGKEVLKSKIAQADSMHWSDASKADSLLIAAEGIYWVDVFKGCYIYKDSFVLQSKPVLRSGKDRLLCRDSLLLRSVRNSDSLRWFNGSAEDSVFINRPGIYWVTHYYKCESVSDTIEISFNPEVRKNKAHFCMGDSLKPIRGLLAGAVYRWNTGAVTPSIAAASGPVYRLSILNDCQNEEDSFYRIQISLPRDTVICGRVSILLDAGLEGVVWNRQTQSRILRIDRAGTYVAKFADRNCSGISDTFRVLQNENSSLIYIPNAFSPNNDGINDVFAPEILDVYLFRLFIYNRWGQCIFSDVNAGWEGRYKGNLVPDGVYMYMLEYADCRNTIRSLSGTLSVLR